MVGKSRLAGLIAAIFAIGLLAGCGDDKKDEGSTAAAEPPKLSGDLKLEPDEAKSAFNKSELTAKPGTVKITVTVPTSAKGQHGVGIDGGTYKDVKGAPVKPGRSTSLTVDLKAGEYVVFDSYKDNRKKGFESKLTVKK